jgi:hypothetical protein
VPSPSNPCLPCVTRISGFPQQRVNDALMVQNTLRKKRTGTWDEGSSFSSLRLSVLRAGHTRHTARHFARQAPLSVFWRKAGRAQSLSTLALIPAFGIYRTGPNSFCRRVSSPEASAYSRSRLQFFVGVHPTNDSMRILKACMY